MHITTRILSLCLASHVLVGCDAPSDAANPLDAPIDVHDLGGDAGKVELIDGAHGAYMVHNGALRRPDSVLRWPDGAQVDVYALGDSVVISAQTPVDSPYRAVINQARGVVDVDDLFTLLAPGHPLPEALRARRSEARMAAEGEQWAYTEDALTYLASREITPASLERRSLAAATNERTEKIGLNSETKAGDGCWYTDWFLYYIATYYPWPAIPQTCWWHSEEYEQQSVYATNWGNYEFAFMNDHGPQMTAIAIFQEKYFAFDKTNWIFLRSVDQGWATSFWWLGAGGWSNMGFAWIAGTSGASHMAYEVY